jgi:hypothetical protein
MYVRLVGRVQRVFANLEVGFPLSRLNGQDGHGRQSSFRFGVKAFDEEDVLSFLCELEGLGDVSGEIRCLFHAFVVDEEWHDAPDETQAIAGGW